MVSQHLGARSSARACSSSLQLFLHINMCSAGAYNYPASLSFACVHPASGDTYGDRLASRPCNMYHGNGHMRGPQPPTSRPPDRQNDRYNRYNDHDADVKTIELQTERARPENVLLAKFRPRELLAHRKVATTLAWSCEGRQLASGAHLHHFSRALKR